VKRTMGVICTRGIANSSIQNPGHEVFMMSL